MPDNPTDLVRIKGVADILGVSRQWAHEITRLSHFPEPVSTDELGRRWARVAVEEFAERRKAAQS